MELARTARIGELIAPTSEVGAFLVGDGTYAEERDRLGTLLVRLGSLAERREHAGAAEAARTLAHKLAEERFNVVVVGEFKRGKTTFVNALLGADVLPAAVVPLTSIVTAVSWGAEVRAEIRFSDGRAEGVAPEDLERYITERGNPRNRRHVERAVVLYPAEELRDGVFVVDTPGVGSVYRHNTEAAYAFVPEADVAIFLTTADPPISDTERGFLKDVREHAARMFFVLNKVDYLAGIDRDEAVEFTRAVIADAVGHDIRLYPVSARRALLAKLVGDGAELEASGVPAFERDFRAFLMDEKGRTILASVADRARTIVCDLRNSIDVEERAAAFSEGELARKVEEMEQVFVRADRRRDDVRALVGKERGVLVTMLEQDLEGLRVAEERALLDEARAFLEEAGDVRAAATALDEIVRSRLRADLDRWRAAEDRRIGEALQGSMARFVEENERIATDTVRLCGDILGIPLVAAAADIGFSTKTGFSYSFFEVPTILESLLPDVRAYLPRRMALRLLERDVRTQVPRLVDKHIGRLRYDFVRRLDDTCRDLERALARRLANTIEGLRDGVQRSMRERTARAEHARLASERARAVRRELDTLEGSLGVAGRGASTDEARR